MNYEKDLKEIWDEYAIKKTIEYNLELAREEAKKEGRQEGRQEGKQEEKEEFVRNLLSANKFTIAEIANFANVTETFARKVKKEMK